MNCEMQLCNQGKARCPTPLTCSGAADDCESAIAALRATHQLHRVDDFTPGSYHPRDAADGEPDELRDNAKAIFFAFLFAAIVSIFGWWAWENADLLRAAFSSK